MNGVLSERRPRTKVLIAEVRARELLETEAREGADDDSLALSSR